MSGRGVTLRWMSSRHHREDAKPPEPPKPLFDQALANQASAVDQCLKLGGVILKPPTQPRAGFGGT